MNSGLSSERRSCSLNASVFAQCSSRTSSSPGKIVVLAFLNVLHAEGILADYFPHRPSCMQAGAARPCPTPHPYHLARPAAAATHSQRYVRTAPSFVSDKQPYQHQRCAMCKVGGP